MTEAIKTDKTEMKCAFVYKDYKLCRNDVVNSGDGNPFCESHAHLYGGGGNWNSLINPEKITSEWTYNYPIPIKLHGVK